MAAVGMVLLTILKIVGWVLLLLLVLLAVLLLAPACVWLKYERETFSVSVGMLGLRIRVWPRPEKKRTAAQQARYEAKQAEKEKKKAENARKKQAAHIKKAPRQKAKLTFAAVCTLAREAKGFVRAVLGALRITHIRFYWTVHAEQAADTALQYGKAQAWLHSGLGVLNNLFWLDFDECRLEPDFTGKREETEYFSCKVSAQLIIIAIAAVKLVLRLKDEDVLDVFL